MPEDMAEGQKYQFWWKGNITPPKDMAKWETLIKKLMERWIRKIRQSRGQQLVLRSLERA